MSIRPLGNFHKLEQNENVFFKSHLKMLPILFIFQCINSLKASDAKWRYRTGSAWDKDMNQCSKLFIQENAFANVCKI